jgi:hypothetical protein
MRTRLYRRAQVERAKKRARTILRSGRRKYWFDEPSHKEICKFANGSGSWVCRCEYCISKSWHWTNKDLERDIDDQYLAVMPWYICGPQYIDFWPEYETDNMHEYWLDYLREQYELEEYWKTDFDIKRFERLLGGRK